MISEIFFSFVRVLLIVFVIFNLFGCTEKETPLPDHLGGQLFQGKIRLDVKCHGCHGWLGEGSLQAPPLVHSGRIKIPPKKFIRTVLFGRGVMPAYQTVLGEKEVLQIIDWLKRIPEQRAP